MLPCGLFLWRAHAQSVFNDSIIIESEACKTRNSHDQIDMYLRMAISAERDQIFWYILARMTAEVLVVNLEVLRGSAHLTAPPIALKDLPAEPRIRTFIKSDSGSLLPALDHDTL
jgi:hypothetical protein